MISTDDPSGRASDQTAHPTAPHDAARAAVRVDYAGEGLTEQQAPAAPYALAETWIGAAIAASGQRPDVPEPSALSVATVDAENAPSVRTVLMRGFDARGPVFFTNLESAKSLDLKGNPAIAAALTWPSLYRAIRFKGTATLLGRDEVQEYFDTRPHGSQVSAWASEQSRPATDRAQLELAWAQALARFPDGEPVPVPPFWGGWRITCTEVEFWAGRSNRLHDRLVYRRVAEGDLSDAAAWSLVRRQP